MLKNLTSKLEKRHSSVADPDFEPKGGGGGGGFTFLAQSAFLSLVISSFFTQNRSPTAFVFFFYRYAHIKS